MSNKVFFERVDLLLVSARSQNSASLRQTLCDLDFRNIRNAETIEDVMKAMDTRPPDFLISDYDLPDGTICDIIRDIRHHRIGINPFMSIIVTTWDPSEAMVREVVDCGADDLLVQPASRKQLSQRVDTLTFNRKPFVVTSNYIGPDRRNGDRPGTQVIASRQVPNMLRARVVGANDSAAIQAEIDRGIQAINFDKLMRNAAHIGYTVQLILSAFQSDEIDETLKEMLYSLTITAEDTIRRLSSTRLAPVTKLCDSLIQVARRLQNRLEDAPPKDLRLLPELAMSIRLALKNVDKNADAADEISQAISGQKNLLQAGNG